MALRALVFSSDGSTTSALCHVLTDLGIEAEICSEMLVAVERITSQPYDALLVDWDQQTEAIFLVKQLRELKLAAQALTLALVQNDQDLPHALQAGANSVIRKPIDAQHAHDTLATAKQLILGRQTEQRYKEARLAAEEAALTEEPVETDTPLKTDKPLEEPQPKKGFLPQTAPRTGIEAEELVASADPAPAPPLPAPEPVSGPSVRERALSILGYASTDRSNPETKQANRASGEAKAIPTGASAEVSEVPDGHEPLSQDATRVFSSLPEESDSRDERAPTTHPHYRFYAFAALVLIAGVLWVFAPGDSYVARLKSIHYLKSLHSTKTPTPQVAVATAQDTAHRVIQAPAPKALEPVLPDPAITDAEDEASSNIQVIENKPIPVAGAQQPPGSETPGDPPTAAVAPDGSNAPSAAPPAVTAPVASAPADAPVAPTHPQLQPAAETQISTSSAPPRSAVVPLPPAVRPPENVSMDPTAGRTGVIIPDSLKNSPSASPASTLEPPTVPEETSRALLVKRVEPDYPPMAIPQRLEGPVILHAYVAQDGTIRDLKLVRGYFLLGRAAFEAVKQWRFKPYTQNGKVIDFQTYITITFKLPS